MGRPEHRVIGRNPSTPEGEPKAKGFQIRVESPDLVFRALEEGASGELGKHLLESPIDEVGVELKTGEDNFNLIGVVSLDFAARSERHISDEAVRRAVAQKLLINNDNGDGKIVEGGVILSLLPQEEQNSF